MKSTLNPNDLLDPGCLALTVRQPLRPVGSNIVFPPTYAGPTRGASVYNINETREGRLAIIDSVQSQANRMEPVFLEPEYRGLLPQVTVKAGEREVNLLTMGHRLADAAIRFSDQEETVRKAFLSYRDQGDAAPLARLGPTSLVFGVWDSRDTHAKVPRLLNAEIRAHDVEELTRSAQYVPTFEYTDIGIDEREQKKAADVGLAHVPHSGPGGVLVHGAIVRTAVLNLVGLRALRTGGEKEDTEALQKYILGLALVALLAPRTYDLRQGCLLAPVPEDPTAVNLLLADGSEAERVPDFEGIRAFAEAAAKEFGVGSDLKAEFSTKKAKEAVKKVTDRDTGKKATDDET